MRAIIFTNFSLLLSVKYFFVFFLTLHDFPIFHLLFRRNRNLIFYFYCFPYKFCGQSKKQMNKSFTTKNCDFVINCKRIGGPQRESDSKRPEKNGKFRMTQRTTEEHQLCRQNSVRWDTEFSAKPHQMPFPFELSNGQINIKKENNSRKQKLSKKIENERRKRGKWIKKRMREERQV